MIIPIIKRLAIGTWVLGILFPACAADDAPVVARGDQVEYFNNIHKVVVSGHVSAIYRDSTLTCDRATIYTQTKDAYLKGQVRLVQPGGILKGEEVIYNFETQKGVILQAESEAGAWRTKGDRGEKVAETAMVQREGYMTSCDFEDPHTRLQAKEVHVYLDDKVVLKNVVTYIGHIPVFYLPSYTYLLDDKRPRVTITPGQRKDWGAFVLTAWRAYFNENLQGRVLIDARERLGLAYGGDFKYIVPETDLPVGGRGTARVYYAGEQKLTNAKHFYGKYLHPDKKTTVNKNRERVQVRHRWDINRDTQALFEVHQMSDASVVHDFFPLEYEKDINPQTYFQVIKTAPWYGLTFLATQRVNFFETVTQNWPMINFQIRPVPIPWLPVLGLNRQQATAAQNSLSSTSSPGWYYQSSFDYAHTNVSSHAKQLGDSLVAFGTLQEVSYVMRVFDFLNTRPYIQFLHKTFSRRASGTETISREDLVYGLNLNTRFFRTYDFKTSWMGLDVNRLRHIITPTIDYKYQAKPTVPTNELFNGGDGLAKSHTIVPGILQELQTKRADGTGKLHAVSLARFFTQVTYDFAAAPVDTTANRHGRFSPVSMDLETKPYKWLYFEADAQSDPYLAGKFRTINFDLLAVGGDKSGLMDLSSDTTIQQKSSYSYSNSAEGFANVPWGIGIGWRYERKANAQVILETEFDLDPKWRVGIYQGFDVKHFIDETTTQGTQRTKKIYDFSEIQYRLRRDLHEWTVELVAGKLRGQGQSVFVIFRLKAAPETPVELQRHYNQPKAGKNYPKL